MVRRPIGRTDQHLTIVAAAPALMFIGNDSLPIVLLGCWVVVVVVLLSLSRRSRPHPARHEWFAVMTGPPPEPDRPPATTHHPECGDVPVQIVLPDTLPDLDDVRGLALETAQLDDLAGAVLDAGRRPVRRSWHGVLVHGDAGSGRTTLVRALAGEHRVPLLVVQARDLVPEGTEGRMRTILARATTLQPCVVLILGLDELSSDRTAATAARRLRAINDLAWHLQTFATERPIVVAGTALSVDRVSPLLLGTGGFDRRIAVLDPDRRERERIIRRELVFAGATYGGDIADVVLMTCDMSAQQVQRLVHASVRSARLDLGAHDRPVVLTRRDVRAGLHLAAASTFDPRTIGRQLSQCLRRFALELEDSQASGGLALVGESGSGKTTIARWLADACTREVTWLTGADLRSLTTRDLETVVEGACARAPVLVVIDDLDSALDARATPRIDAKHLAVAAERLLTGQGTSMVMTASDASSIRRVDDGMVDICWVGRPGFHDRVHLIRHALAEADLAGTTDQEVAAHLHGLTRAAIVQICERAVRIAAIRTPTTVDGRQTPLAVRFEDLRPPGTDRPSP